MPETIFWDTAAFIALGNADDELHTAAVTSSSQLAHAGARILTTEAVLTEVANTFSKATWRSVARHLIESVRESAAMQMATVVHVDAALWQRGWDFFLARPDKDWGLTDCFSFVVMQDHGVTRAFTSDRHFEQAGFERLLMAG